MSFLPLLQRELRSLPRQPSFYGLRSFGALFAILVLLLVLVKPEGSTSEIGGRLFGTLYSVLLIAVWFWLPTLTADTLSRELRDGTLGLLFLTPLTQRGVVAAKGLVHLLRGLGWLTATFPVLVLPFLLGGVTWLDGFVAAAFLSCSMVTALAAGLFASAGTPRRTEAVVASISLGLLLVLVVVFASGVSAVIWARRSALGGPFESWSEALAVSFAVGTRILLPVVESGRSWSRLLAPGSLASIGLGIVLPVVVLCFALTGVLIQASAWRLRRTWANPTTHVPLSGWRWLLLDPWLFRTHYLKSQRRLLARNPVAWLGQRTVRARLIKWGWCFLAVLVAPPAALSHSWPVLFLWTVLFFSAYAAEAAFGLAAESRSESFELLWVTALPRPRFLTGQLFSTWSRYCPAAAVTVLAWWLDAAPYAAELTRLMRTAALLAAFLGVPVIALYHGQHACSLSRAAVRTWFASFPVPILLAGVLTTPVVAVVKNQAVLPSLIYLLYAVWVSAIAADCWRRLRAAPLIPPAGRASTPSREQPRSRSRTGLSKISVPAD